MIGGNRGVSATVVSARAEHLGGMWRMTSEFPGAISDGAWADMRRKRALLARHADRTWRCCYAEYGAAKQERGALLDV